MSDKNPQKTNYDSQKWTSELRRLGNYQPTRFFFIAWGITKGFITYGVEKLPNFPTPRLRMTFGVSPRLWEVFFVKTHHFIFSFM